MSNTTWPVLVLTSAAEAPHLVNFISFFSRSMTAPSASIAPALIKKGTHLGTTLTLTKKMFPSTPMGR